MSKKAISKKPILKRQWKNWHLETDEDDIVWLHFDKAESSTNVFSADVFVEFFEVLDQLSEMNPKGLIILSDKENGFIAGANIEEFTQLESEEQALELIRVGQSAFDKLEALPFPTLSLINGFCLGGGMEMSLACDYRIALDEAKTRLGLPEVLLGIHPGWGGTMRLPRLIGAPAAMDLMLSGRTVSARAAKKMGIVDHIAPQRHLKRAAKILILKRPVIRTAGKIRAIANTGVARPLLAKYLRKQVAKRAPEEHYPAPYALIDLWEKYAGDEKTMLTEEAISVARLMSEGTAKNLVRVFLLQERLKSLGKGVDFQPKHIHVIGAGIMGGDIAAWCALKGLTVTLQDREPKFIAPAIKRAHALFKKRLKVPYLIQAAKDRLIPDLHGTGVKSADVVIEAIIENKEAKQKLFSQIESLLKPDTILATNTSSIPLDELSETLQQPDRLVGIHFFNPVAKMQLVEIVEGKNTSQENKNKAAKFCRCIDRLPLPVKSSPGFLVNRILMPYLMEAVKLLEDGVPAQIIDRAATDFGMPMGPILLADTVGLDICLSVAEILGEALGLNVPEALRKKVEAGEFGVKSGQGFYQYQKGKQVKGKVNANGSDSYSEDIADRLILQMLNESIACLREGVIGDMDMVDVGMIFGTGFAPFRGGPMHYMEHRGRQVIIDRLKELESQYGERFAADKGWQAVG
ncbi:MAG: enoyl-CoA hydratase/isomerase family protein [Proteobacteria bacterium]|nr:enoyl-CoA hydratase/isomerase family protein [Pseudomonadota bacterium]